MVVKSGRPKGQPALASHTARVNARILPGTWYATKWCCTWGLAASKHGKARVRMYEIDGTTRRARGTEETLSSQRQHLIITGRLQGDGTRYKHHRCDMPASCLWSCRTVYYILRSIYLYIDGPPGAWYVHASHRLNRPPLVRTRTAAVCNML